MNVHGFILPSRIIGIFMLLAAMIPAVIGVFLYKRTSNFLARAATVQGSTSSRNTLSTRA